MRAPIVAAMMGLLGVLPPAAQAQLVVPSGQSLRQRPPAAQLCVGCHGARGEADLATGVPRIAAQSRYYLTKQLDDYAAGRRRHPAMEAMARILSRDDRAAYAAYYSQLEAPAPGRSAGGPPSERGRLLATIGDARRGVQACANCHGPDGVGQPPTSPYLAGLDASFISADLNAWKGGGRSNDDSGQMTAIAKALPPEDIAAVARYYASLPPPRPGPPDIVQSVLHRRAAPGRIPSATQSGEPSRRDRAGVEQGAPMTGGTQGAGGGAATDAPAAGRAPEQPSSVIYNVPVRDGDPARGRRLVASGAHGCAACHTIPGIRAARGVVGPPLGGLARRSFIAGGLPNNASALVAFLQDPPAFVPNTGMPNVGLRLEEARDIAAFLSTLERARAW
ncbi:MAG TPA: c-type cytochrome [Methylomirabilota bacterium]|jgi:cytochrome c553|nr:c-type cytochrome [Methylomirabilota bacterium]